MKTDHDVGVELGACAALELDQRPLRRQCPPVRPVRSHGIEGIRHGENSRRDGDLRSLEPLRVPAAVPALVVVQDSRNRSTQRPDEPDHPRACCRMTPYLVELLRGQRACFAQHILGDRELADVVQRGPHAHDLDLVFVQSEPSGDHLREHHHARRVAARVRVACLDRAREVQEPGHGRRTSRPSRLTLL